jgi:DNA-directed RNA polymerase subunit N (RpoN/RPB10)
MIIPIRCFTCNRILASKYQKYLKLKELNKSKEDLEFVLDGKLDTESKNEEIIDNLAKKNKELFESIGIDRYCCKRHLMTHIDLIHMV